ncbi:MAG: FG-GAP-like repeat-containing protein [Hyphomicrobiaceae bacterium]
MATIIGTGLDDSITPTGNSTGVTGGLPSIANDSIDAGDGNDTIIGGGGMDTVLAGLGNDIIHQQGLDSIAGGLGTDSVYFTEAIDYVLDYRVGTGSFQGVASVSGVENFFLNSGDDHFYASDANFMETGSVNGVYVDGGAGNDILWGTSAADSLVGGDGDDILVGAGGSDKFFDTAGINEIYGDTSTTDDGATDTWYDGAQMTGGSGLTNWFVTFQKYSNGSNSSTTGSQDVWIVRKHLGHPMLDDHPYTNTLTGIEDAVFGYGSGTEQTVALRQATSNFNFGALNDAGSTSDMVLQNGGSVVAWTIHNNTAVAGTILGGGLNGWTVSATGDINRDGTSDIILQNGGDVVAWSMQNGSAASGSLISSGANGWSVKATADIDNDGDLDIILQNGGAVVAWEMEAGAAVADASSVSATTAGTSLVQVTSSRRLERHPPPKDGVLVAWNMLDGQFAGGAAYSTGLAGWTVKGTGDFDGDNDTDVVVQNGGEVVMLLTGAGGMATAGNLVGSGLSGWEVAAVGDYNGDGISDIALQNGGAIVTWTLQNGMVTAGTGVGSAGSYSLIA